MVHSIYCVGCGKRVSGDGIVYPARLFFNLSDGVTDCVSPACSPECAKSAVDKQINMMENYIGKLKEQPKYTTTANEYKCPSERGGAF